MTTSLSESGPKAPQLATTWQLKLADIAVRWLLFYTVRHIWSAARASKLQPVGQVWPAEASSVVRWSSSCLLSLPLCGSTAQVGHHTEASWIIVRMSGALASFWKSEVAQVPKVWILLIYRIDFVGKSTFSLVVLWEKDRSLTLKSIFICISSSVFSFLGTVKGVVLGNMSLLAETGLTTIQMRKKILGLWCRESSPEGEKMLYNRKVLMKSQGCAKWRHIDHWSLT